jgi:Spy/CpxP family protein refolding chaperone
MKKIIVGLALVVGSFVGAQAQENHDSQKQDGGMHRHRHGMNMEKLNLSDAQKAKFKSMNEDFRNQMQDLKKQDNITVKEWRTRKEDLMKSHHEAMMALLTPDQKDKMKDMRNGHPGTFGKNDDKDDRADRGGRGDRGGHENMEDRGGRGDRSDMMKTRLGLTDKQAEQMQDVRKDMGAQFRDIKENKSLSEDQKEKALKDLKEKREDRIKSILTDEQYKKFKEGHQQPEKKQTL